MVLRLCGYLAFVGILAGGGQGLPAQARIDDNLLKLPGDAVKNHGTLIIVGGGSTPQQAKDEFLRLAGGRQARIVLVPSAYDYGSSETAKRRYLGWFGGASSFEVVDTNLLTVEQSKKFEHTLDGATGVWIGGGSQTRLMGIYGRTRVEEALRRVLARGGVIGGTSAGAAVMSRVMIRAGTLENPGLGTGFGFLEGAIVDQHFTQRKRETRLLVVLKKHADLTGLGVDERTALVVAGNELRVLGDNLVSVYPPGGPERTALRLKAGDRANLVASAGGIEFRVSPANMPR
jgi:cyanophycinase